MPRISVNPAIIPKARGMFSERISKESYSELCRKRTVAEVARYLKNHPYFENSLASLSDMDPHRGQIEELLRKDIYIKYERLAHYIPRADKFGRFFVLECEITELLTALTIISIEGDKRYISSLPSFLIQKLSFDLMELAKAVDYGSMLKVIAHTPYYKILKELYDMEPTRRLLAAEARLWSYYYKTVLKAIDSEVPAGERRGVKILFLEELELTNINMLVRIKKFFIGSFTPSDIRKILIPYRYLLSKRRLNEMSEAQDFNELCDMIETSIIGRLYSGPKSPDFLLSQQRRRYKRALHRLHLTTSPSVSLAAFIILSKLERLNIVNVIEGVRYKLPPTEIESLLRN